MKRIKVLAIFNALSLIVHLGTAYFIQSKQLNQKDVGEVLSKYETLFTPAPVTFGVWGIIYTALGILCLYHIVIAYKHDKWHPTNTDLERMGLFFIVTNLANAAWLVAWTQERLLVSLALVLLQLVGLIAIHIRLHLYDRSRPAGSKTCTQFPLSIYLAWISMIAIINTAAWLFAIGWEGWGLTAPQWTLILVSFAVGLALLMIYFRHNIYFGFVVTWTLYGIILNLRDLNSNAYDHVINTAWMGLGLTVLSCLIQIFSNNRYKKPREIFPSAHAPLK